MTADALAFRTSFIRVLADGLPGEDAHVIMSPLSRARTSEALKTVTDYRESAVAIHLFWTENRSPYFILMKRPDYEGTHSGQVSFPGGKRENTDPDLIYTARRESFEETGISLSAGEYLGQLSEVYIPVSGFLVQAYVFFHTAYHPLEADPREVDTLFEVELAALLHPGNVSTMQVNTLRGELEVPCFRLGEVLVWGATAIILSELKELLNRFIRTENGQIQVQ